MPELIKLGRIKAKNQIEAVDKIYATVPGAESLVMLGLAPVQPYADEFWFEYVVRLEKGEDKIEN